MTGPRRVDANQAEIVTALRAVGASVLDLHTVGRGCPDIAVGWRGLTFLLEVKSARGRLTGPEQKFHESWRGQVAIARNIAQALAVLGVKEEADG
jgi:hypothetical protein